MKRLVLFTEDHELVKTVGSCIENFQSYFYDLEMSNIKFNSDDVILLDYDYDKIDMKRFLNGLIAVCPSSVQLLVLSYNCERKEVVDLAKRGVDRFIVKPLGKKRFKSLFDPYLGLAQPHYAQDVL